MTWDILLAAVIALLILGILWAARGMVLTPLPKGRHTHIKIRLEVSGRENTLEQTVRALLWLIGNGTLHGTVQIVDCGMDSDTRVIAEKLAENVKVEWVGNNPYGQSCRACRDFRDG